METCEYYYKFYQFSLFIVSKRLKDLYESISKIKNQDSETEIGTNLILFISVS